MNLVITNVNKTYPNGVRALQDVNLEIGSGMFGLLGANGAGKSTLMRTLATLQMPDSGSIQLGEFDVLKQPDEIRRVLGYLPQEFGAIPRVSAFKMLDHLAMLKGVVHRRRRRDLVAEMLDKVNLYAHRNKSVAGYSGGMKQRFGIAQALLCEPLLLIVDEPTAGLDPTERNRFYNLLAEVGESTIVILSTHIVQDVRELCSQMAILDQGEVLFSGSPDQALQNLSGRIWQKVLSRDEMSTYRNDYRVLSEKLVAGRRQIHVISDQVPGDGFESVAPDLEDVYFSIASRSVAST